MSENSRELVQLELLPLGKTITTRRGTPLQDLLFGVGVEFPCGGHGRCKGCKIKLLRGSSPPSPEDLLKLSQSELAQGWRLACRAGALTDLRIELAQWESAILSDESTFEFKPRAGFGVAVDLGTTTIVAQLLDLQTGHVLAVESALNAQARHGADIMSRIEFALSDDNQLILERIIREQIGQIIGALVSAARVRRPNLMTQSENQSGYGVPDKLSLESVVIVGNTVMHHLFSGISVQPLAQYPFVPASPGLQTFNARALGWDLPGDPKMFFLPCLGGFVGSDILAGVLATGMHERESLSMLIDLGTNGELVLGNHEKLLCAGTAAGPAFEGARISMGMRAATGAISEAWAANGQLRCRILGDVTPRGICGSGLVDAVAASLELGWVLPSGRLAKQEKICVAPSVSLNQRDVRELQLAKGAIAAGARILLQQWGATEEQLMQVFLAGAFGNYLNQPNARRIGLLEFAPEKVVPAGNTALLGAKLALFNLAHEDISYPGILRRTSHVSLHEAPGFQEIYAEKMGFPASW